MPDVADFEWVGEIRDQLAVYIADFWHEKYIARGEWRELQKERRNYVFATDTKTTSNSKLPWKNSTTIPKLCQIRDNLHANYMAQLFPHEEWLQWEAGDEDSASEKVARTVEGYMRAKLREQNFQTIVSQMVYDFIDGNVIGDVVWEANYKELENENETVANYVGPKAVRISPMDHVFDATAVDYQNTPKVTRYLKTIGQLKKDAKNKPDLAYDEEMIDKVIANRKRFQYISSDDIPKQEAFQVDGFGSLFYYFKGDVVEILEFEGDYYDMNEGDLVTDRIVTVVDRSFVIRNIQNPSWLGESSKQFAGWRLRPDNLWAMGALDNLIGMQYRIDHIENAKADAVDQYIHPPKKIRGYVEDFSDNPGERIYVGDDGDVEFMRPPLDQILAYDQELQYYMNLMEEMAGAPREAMGIRSPGEKTAYEIQSLENSAGRIFQNKIKYFEQEFLEPFINKMFEMAKRKLNTPDVVRVLNDDLKVVEFLEVSKSDLAVKGKFRPIGARHFAEQAKTLQELTGFMASPLGQDPGVAVHVSGINLAKAVEKLLNVEKYKIFKPNIRIFETAQTQKLANAAGEGVEVDAITPTEEEVPIGVG